MANSRTTFTVADAESPDDMQEIEDALADREGVQMVETDAETGEVEVRHGEELISEEEIESTVRELGYDVD